MHTFTHANAHTQTLPNLFHCSVRLPGHSKTFRLLVPIELRTVLNSCYSLSQCIGLRYILVNHRLPGFRCKSRLALFLPPRTLPMSFHWSATLSGTFTDFLNSGDNSDMFHNMRRVFQLNPHLDLQTDMQRNFGNLKYPTRIHSWVRTDGRTDRQTNMFVCTHIYQASMDTYVPTYKHRR